MLDIVFVITFIFCVNDHPLMGILSAIYLLLKVIASTRFEE